ncbi:hypothetical protein DI392_08950 [Vibrio albus]|uniref:EAL domain-containing protein n=1 Tax=Vibrio albus TaxID=2200953 RepID=A0A2U3BA32_9VIBR|nr:EAL domain-containing protein [Vibrio albus]PWI33584.1 hypothetical protein DI392_08950 [Vibrio albus]
MTRFNLADKASFLFSSGILLVVFVCLLLTRYFYIQQIDTIEQTQLNDSARLAKTAISSLATEQEEYSYDWAHWDETYLLLKESDPTYAGRNLGYNGLTTLKLSLMMFVNKDKDIIESAFIPPDSAGGDAITAVPDSYLSVLFRSQALNRLFTSPATDTTSTSGLLNMAGTPWLISVTNVTDSLEEQDTNGWMIWGTPLSSKFPSKLKPLLSDKYEITGLPETTQETQPVIVRTPHAITRTDWLTGIDGNPVAQIHTTTERVLYQHANHIINTISLILGVATVITLFVVLYLFRTKIGTSFTRLEEEHQTQTGIIDSLSSQDQVSGLHNRQSVLMKLHKLLSEPDLSFSLLYISVDRLKPLSQIFGHRTVETIIRHLAQSFTRYAPGSAIVGRVTESDFVIACPHTQSGQALMACAENIANLYRRQTIIDDLDIQLAVSIGYLEDASVLNGAEETLTCGKYTAQISGAPHQHGITRFSDSVIRQFTQHQQLQKDLASAIKTKAIAPYYQPIVDAKGGQAVGFEALARWTHPELGMISPGIFIPMAEERNFIITLGEQILEQSCRFISQLNRERQQHGLPPMTIHVNLSAPHLQHHGLLPYIDSLLKRFDIEPHLLTLELTESILIDSVSDVTELLTQLRKKHIRIAIDDFGTGFSSLSTLSSFPVDVIKLDRNFVLQLEHNEKGYALVRNIVQLAKDMQLNTVIEGVETERQRKTFTQLNVDTIQGFYFYKPMPAESALYQFSEPEY